MTKFPLVPRAGLEPARTCVHRILSPACLPFHHQGKCVNQIIKKGEKQNMFALNPLGAENETRTRDPDLGKVVLYQLSYFRLFAKCDANIKPYL